MRIIKTQAAALLLATGILGAAGLPARADVCDQLANRIAQLQAEEDNTLARMGDTRSYSTTDGGRIDPLAGSTREQRALLQMYNGTLTQIRAKRASYERQYAKKNCGEYQAQRNAANQAATNAALGAIGFGIMSGAMSGGYRGGYGGRSGYSSGSSSGSYRRY